VHFVLLDEAFEADVAPGFGINAQVIEVRLDGEGIWLAT
jgi:hypothetical protein